VGKKG